jgi:hypothetical protein
MRCVSSAPRVGLAQSRSRDWPERTLSSRSSQWALTVVTGETTSPVIFETARHGTDPTSFLRSGIGRLRSATPDPLRLASCGRVLFREPDDPQTRSISHLRMLLLGQDAFEQPCRVRPGLLGPLHPARGRPLQMRSVTFGRCSFSVMAWPRVGLRRCEATRCLL